MAGIAAGALTVASPGSSSGGTVVNGVGPSNGVVGSGVVPGNVDALLNFDDVNAPCVFKDTTALRLYHGVKFAGGAPLDGGAILNECGNFGVSGYSPPNFLAFNCSSQNMDGGIPTLPETIKFPSKSASVSLKIGGPEQGKTVTIKGKGEKHTVTLTSAMQTVVFTKATKKLTLTTSTGACILVVDDITF
jgi:hypothetical protein